MTQDARDDRLLGNSSNNTERAASAKGTGGHIQRKHAPQEPGPAPGRGPKRRLLPVHPPLARCRNDRVPKLAMRRQTPRIAHQMDARQGTSAASFSSVCPGRLGPGIRLAGRATTPSQDDSGRLARGRMDAAQCGGGDQRSPLVRLALAVAGQPRGPSLAPVVARPAECQRPAGAAGLRRLCSPGNHLGRGGPGGRDPLDHRELF